MDKIKELFSYCVGMPGVKKRQRPSTERSSPSKRNKNNNSNNNTTSKATAAAASQDEPQALLSQNSASVISAQSPPAVPSAPQSQDTTTTTTNATRASAQRADKRSPSKPRRSKGMAATTAEIQGVNSTGESHVTPRPSMEQNKETAKETKSDGEKDVAIAPLQVTETHTKTDIAPDRTSTVIADKKGEEAAAPREKSNKSNSAGVHALEEVVLRTKVIAPDVSGIRCIAVNESESELVVGRENGSLVLYRMKFFQNVPHFTLLRHTGGVAQRTMTRLLYLTAPPSISSERNNNSSSNAAAVQHEWLVASYLSGQIVLYDGVTLFPCAVVQRAGGAVWDMCRVNSHTLYAAMANNTWHQLELCRGTKSTASEAVGCCGGGGGGGVELVLRRIVPGVTGADRALTVACSLPMHVAVGGDDAGNVHAWLPVIDTQQEGDTTTTSNTNSNSKMTGGVGVGVRLGLGEHTTLWTTRLPSGMALALLCIPHRLAPVVVVGTSVGDVVLLDSHNGQLRHRFTQHKGPVTALVSDGVAFYASGWHESLRAYRCTALSSPSSPAQEGARESEAAHVGEAKWYPAEVKRRTHYHEATQLLLCAQHELLLSSARDGTIMYSTVGQLFRSPAMYLTVTTQQFAFAQARNILLQSRIDRVEGFGMSAAQRHWLPLFAHRLQGHHHIGGLWCDAALRYVVAATDERVVVCYVTWRKAGKQSAAATTMTVQALREVLELPARRGVLDACFVIPEDISSGNNNYDDPAKGKTDHSHDHDDNEEDEQRAAAAEEEEVKKKERTAGRRNTRAKWLYLLSDDGIAFAALSANTTPIVVHTAFDLATGNASASAAHTLRPLRIFYDSPSRALRVFGLYGVWQCRVLQDGTPDAATQQFRRDRAYSLVQVVPKLHKSNADSALMNGEGERQGGDDENDGGGGGGGEGGAHEQDGQKQKEVSEECTWIGLALSTHYNTSTPLSSSSSASASASAAAMAGTRYMAHIQRELPQPLARTLPHDAIFIAELAGPLCFAPPREESPFHTRRNKGRLSGSAQMQGRSGAVEKYNNSTSNNNNNNSKERAYVAYFSKGLLVSNGAAWRMAQRMSIEAAFVMRDQRHLLVLERNLEKTLESLPLCWKVRRFGN